MTRLPRLSRLSSLILILGLLGAACGGGQNFVSLTGDDPVAEVPEGLTVSVNPAALPDNFGVQLAAVPAEAFLAGDAGEAWQTALAALPGSLRLSSAVFEVKTRGDLPQEMFLSVVVPSGHSAQRLDMYAWDGTGWSFLPAQAGGGQLVAAVSRPPAALALFETAPLPPLAFTTLEPGQALTPVAGEALNAVLLGGVLVQADGSLGGQVPGVALDQSFAVYPVVRNHASAVADPGLLEGVLGDEAARGQHLLTLVNFAVAGGYDGVVLDYLGVTPELAPAYAQFVHDLAEQLRGEGKSLLVQVEAPARSDNGFSTGGYDWRALGAAADVLLLPMAADPTAYGNGQAEALVAWAVGEVPRARLRLVTTALSVEGAEGEFTFVDHASALAPLGGVTLAQAEAALVPGEPIEVKLSGNVESLAYDAQAYAASFAYTDAAGTDRTLWLTSADTLRQRLALAEAYQLGGVVVNDLMAPGVPADLLNAVTQYKAAVDAAVAAHAELLWTVRNSSGILALATAQPDQPYRYVAPAPGQYEFSAYLQPGQGGGLGSLAVQVAAITATPSPEPSATATTAQTITGGATAQPQPTTSGQGTPGSTPANTPQPTATSSGGGVFIPPPPIGAGTFELGGQVPGFIGHPTEMQQAHMRWVKFQVRGGGFDYITAAHGAGFKVLLSVIGDKGRVTDPAYWAEYAGWVASLAAAGADAIEVWNEPNIDHEWPEGQINAATYTQLLSRAYSAIKGANGGTIVISGGPAPTGAEGAFPGRVVNDDRFLREMAAAGAANYMDCIGIHYNTGTTSPNATSGATLSGYHYSYYFWPMVDTYWNAFGGTRPLCFTELGYLTPEGYGDLPGNFGWAATTSLAEHAQWLAEAASLAGNSGKVRLMMIWNVDFTLWSGDPQAGYAIVRPDGSCPACSALGAVVP